MARLTLVTGSWCVRVLSFDWTEPAWSRATRRVPVPPRSIPTVTAFRLAGLGAGRLVVTGLS